MLKIELVDFDKGLDLLSVRCLVYIAKVFDSHDYPWGQFIYVLIILGIIHLTDAVYGFILLDIESDSVIPRKTRSEISDYNGKINKHDYFLNPTLPIALFRQILHTVRRGSLPGELFKHGANL